jgi:hypothetical protein
MLLSSISGARRAVPGVSALGLPFESQHKTRPHFSTALSDAKAIYSIAVKAGNW